MCGVVDNSTTHVKHSPTSLKTTKRGHTSVESFLEALGCLEGSQPLDRAGQMLLRYITYRYCK